MLSSQLIKIYNMPKERLIEIALNLAMHNTELFFEIADDTYEGAVFEFNGTQYTVPASACAEISVMKEAQKIAAIKAVRTASGIDLLPAKLFVEAFAGAGYMDWSSWATPVDQRVKLISVHRSIKKR